jgi:tetratricopeptide (TPR) repeat protein
MDKRPVHAECALQTDSPQNGRLDSWKEIASFLRRNERTVQRWYRQSGLPVYHVHGAKRSSVFAYQSELEEWLNAGSPASPHEEDSSDVREKISGLTELWECRSGHNILQIVFLCRSRIDENPRDAEAYGVLAAAHIMCAAMFLAPSLDAFARTNKAAEKALGLDPLQIHALSAQGLLVMWRDGDQVAAERLFREALAQNPDFGFALFGLTLVCILQRRIAEAEVFSKRARLSEPLSPVMNNGVIWLNYLMGHFDRVVWDVQSAIRSGDDSPGLRGIGGLAGILMGQADLSVRQIRAGLKIYPTNVMLKGVLGYGLGKIKQSETARQYLEDLICQYHTSNPIIVNRLEMSRASTAFSIALLYAALSQRDKVLDWLREGMRDCPFWMLTAEVNPALSILGKNSEFNALVDDLRSNLRK